MSAISQMADETVILFSSEKVLPILFTAYTRKFSGRDFYNAICQFKLSCTVRIYLYPQYYVFVSLDTFASYYRCVSVDKG